MDFWKLPNPKRAAIAGFLSVLLAFSGVSTQAIAEAIDEGHPSVSVADGGGAGVGGHVGDADPDSEGPATDPGVEDPGRADPGAPLVDAGSADGDPVMAAGTGEPAAQVSPDGDEAGGAGEPSPVIDEAALPERWTIVLLANGGELAPGVEESQTRLQTVEGADPLMVPSPFEREGHRLSGWSTLPDPVGWQEARAAELEADPASPEPADAPRFVIPGSSLYDLGYHYVVLEDDTLLQVSDVVAAQGHDGEGREVIGCDLRDRVVDGTLTLYAQWEPLIAEDADEPGAGEDEGDPEGPSEPAGTAGQGGEGEPGAAGEELDYEGPDASPEPGETASPVPSEDPGSDAIDKAPGDDPKDDTDGQAAAGAYSPEAGAEDSRARGLGEGSEEGDAAPVEAARASDGGEAEATTPASEPTETDIGAGGDAATHEGDEGDTRDDAASPDDQALQDVPVAKGTAETSSAEATATTEPSAGDSGGRDTAAEPPASAEVVPDSPTGVAALLADPETVLDSSQGDPQVSELLDKAEHDAAARRLFGGATGAPGHGLDTPVVGTASLDDVTGTRAPQYRDGTTIEDFSLVWNTVDTTDDGDASHLDLVPADDAALNLQARLQFALSGEKNYEPGSLQLTIPAQVIRDRHGNHLGSMTIGVPEEPDSSQSFAYRLVTPDAGDPYYVITNMRTLDSATTGIIQFSIRGITPHMVESGAVSPALQAEMSLTTARGNQMLVSTDPLTATISTAEHISHAYKNGGKVMELIDVTPDIRAALEAVSPTTTVNDYVIVRWNTYANVEGNQAFRFEMVDTLSDGGAVREDGVPITPEGVVVLGATGTPSDAPGSSYAKEVLPDGSYLESGESRYENVWTAYPKALFENDKEYELTNHVTWTLTPTDDPETATSLSRQSTIAYRNPRPVAFSAEPGRYIIEKETLEPHKYPTSTNTSLTDLAGIETGGASIAPKDATIGFTVTASGEIMEETLAEGVTLDELSGYDTTKLHQRYVTLEAADDTVYLAGDYASELTSADYYISHVHLSDPCVYLYGHRDGDETKEWGYFRARDFAPLPGMELWGLSEGAGGTAATWTKLASVSYSGSNARSVQNVASGVTHDGPNIYMDESLGITRIKVVTSSKDVDSITLEYNPYITLRCDGPRVEALVDRLFAESDEPETSMRNDVTLVAYHGNALGGTGTDAPTVDPADAALTAEEGAGIYAIPHSPQPTDYDRTLELDEARYGKRMWHYSTLAYLRGSVPRVGVTSTKQLSYDPRPIAEGGDLDTGAMQAHLHYVTRVHEQSNILTREAYDNLVEDGAIVPETSGTWYDLLPPGVTPVLSSIRLRGADAVQDAYTIENYRDSGRTLLVVQAELVPHVVYNAIVEGASAGEGYWSQGYYDEPTLSFDAVYSYADYQATGEGDAGEPLDELINIVAFESGNDALGNQEGMEGEYDDATGGAGGATFRNKETEAAVEDVPDIADVASVMSDLDGSLGPAAKKPTFVYARDETHISVDRSSVSSITKYVASDAEGVYRLGTGAKGNQVNVYEGHGYTYRIAVGHTTESSDIVLYDALERYQLNDSNADYDIRDQRWRGTLSRVDVSQIESMGVAPVVYYSTSITRFDARGSMASQLDDGMGVVPEGSVQNTLDANPGAWVRADAFTGNLADVTAVAIDCTTTSGGDPFVLASGSSLVAYLHMRAPIEVADQGQSELFGTIDPSGDEDDPDNNSHAFNNVYISSAVRGESGTNTRTEFYHPDYVKVGILPFKIKVSKTWDDANDNDGKRPDHVTVHLLADGAVASHEDGSPVGTIELGGAHAGQAGYGDDGWSYTVEDIPYVDGDEKVIHYTLGEDPITEEVGGSLVRLYSPSYLRTDDAHLQIVNRRVPATVDVSGTKTWNDDGDAAGVRPSTIRLRLLADGRTIASQVVSEASDGTWSYAFTDLPAFEEGERIAYTVVEEPVDRYVADYAPSSSGTGSTVGDGGSVLGSTDITNTYSATGLLGITKTVEGPAWPSVENADFTFRVTLFGDGVDDDGHPLPLGESFDYYLLDAATGERVPGTGYSYVDDSSAERTCLGGSLVTGGTVTLKGGQRAIIEGLPVGSTYVVTEVATPGFTQSSSAHTSGTILAGTAPRHAADARFVNTYTSEGSFQLGSTKRLVGQRLGRYAFRFQAYQVFGEGTADEYEQLVRSVSNNAGGDMDGQGVSEGDVTFGRINVTDADLGPDGTLTLLYRIREVDAGKSGYSYADNVEQVRVTLADQGDGTIVATQVPEEVASGISHIRSLDNASTTDEPFSSQGDATFTNRYTATGDLELGAWKVLRGRQLVDREFSFRLTALTEGAPMATAVDVGTGAATFDASYDAATRSMTATNDAHGVVTFPTIKLTGAHGGESYVYRTSEVAGSAPGVHYSTEAYFYQVDVVDNGDGTLTASQTVVEPRGDADAADVAAGVPGAFVASDVQAVFTNTLDPGSLTVEKTLESGSEYHDEDFEFSVVLRGDDISDPSALVVSGGSSTGFADDGAGTYRATITLGAGQVATIADIPAGTSYQVFEETMAGWQLVGQSGIAGTIGSLTQSQARFTNQYAPTTAQAKLHATKTLDGAAAPQGAFSFSLRALSSQVGGVTTAGAPMPEDAAGTTLEVHNGAAGLVDFGAISYEHEGVYTYQITEVAGPDADIVYDAGEWQATVTVTNTGTTDDPVLAAQVRYSDGTDDPSGAIPSFANTTKPGTLTVTKTGVNLTPLNRDTDFSFTVQLQNDGQPVDDVTYHIVGADGSMSGQAEGAEADTAVHEAGARDAATRGTEPASQGGFDLLGALGQVGSCALEALGGVFSPTVAYAVTDSSTFGENGSCTWEWDMTTRTVTIRATAEGVPGVFGEGFNPRLHGVPWSSYTSLMEHLVVDDSYGPVSMRGTNGTLALLCQNNTRVKTVDLSKLDLSEYYQTAAGTSASGSIQEAFSGCTQLTSVKMPRLTDSKGLTAASLFNGCTSLEEVVFQGFDITGNSISMFQGCTSLETIDLSSLNIVNNALLTYLFQGCTSLTSVDMSMGGTANLSSLDHVFYNCSALESVDFSGFDARNLTNIRYVFSGCSSLTNLDLRDWDATLLEDVEGAFAHCTSLQSLDISTLGMREVYSAKSFLRDDTQLSKIVLGDDFASLSDFNNPPDPTREWVMVENPGGGTKTIGELMTSDGAEVAGTWVWAVDPDQFYVVSFNTMGAYYDTTGVPVPGSLTMPRADSITLPTPRWDDESRTFAGWNRESDFSGASFDGGGTYSRDQLFGANTSAYITLYAEWDDNTTYTGTVNIYHQTTDLSGYALIASGTHTFTEPAGSTETLTPEDYDGFVTPPPQDVTVAQGASVDFYYDRVTYTVTFDKNAAGATGSMADLTMLGGVARRLTANAFAYADHSFLGWNTEADGTGTSYTDRAQVKNLAGSGGTVTLYAQWVASAGGGASSSGTYRITLKPGQTVRFVNVPAGTTYRVVETDLPNGWTQTTAAGTSGTVAANATSAASVTNTYDATGAVSLQARKDMASGALAEGQFSFTLSDGSGVVQTKANLAPEGDASTAQVLFDQIDYELADLFEGDSYVGPKVYTYTVREVDDGQAGVSYDGGERSVRVTVADGGTGRLVVTPDNLQTTGSGASATASTTTVFENDYDPGSLRVSKTVVGAGVASADATFAFRVEVTDATGAALSGSSSNGHPFTLTRVAADGAESSDGTVDFSAGSVTVSGVGAGEAFVIHGLSQGARYSVAEVAKPGFTQTAASGASGTIVAGGQSQASFTNAYAAEGSASLRARKTLRGGDISGYTFTFQLYDEANALLQTKTNDGEGNVAFDPLDFSAADAGSESAPRTYSYRIQEVNDAQADVAYDTDSEWVTVSVWDDGEGTLHADVAYDAGGGAAGFTNSLLHPIAMPETGGPGLNIPALVAAIAVTADGARRLHVRRRRRR